MKPTKNKRRIDPRYFLNETADRDNLGDDLIREFWRGAHMEGFFSGHEHGVASLTKRIDELMNEMSKDYKYAQSVAYSNSCRGAGIILELTNIVFEKGGDFFNRVATDGNPQGARSLVDRVKQLVEKIQMVRDMDADPKNPELKTPLKKDIGEDTGGCSNENDPIPVGYFKDMYGRNQENLLNDFYERMERIIASPHETERMQKQQPGYDPSIREEKNE